MNDSDKLDALIKQLRRHSDLLIDRESVHDRNTYQNAAAHSAFEHIMCNLSILIYQICKFDRHSVEIFHSKVLRSLSVTALSGTDPALSDHLSDETFRKTEAFYDTVLQHMEQLEHMEHLAVADDCECDAETCEAEPDLPVHDDTSARIAALETALSKALDRISALELQR